MLAFTLSSLKDATSHLFTQPSFDDFDVLSVTIVSYITFSMDGHLNAAFFDGGDCSADESSEKGDDASCMSAAAPITEVSAFSTFLFNGFFIDLTVLSLIK